MNPCASFEELMSFAAKISTDAIIAKVIKLYFGKVQELCRAREEDRGLERPVTECKIKASRQLYA